MVAACPAGSTVQVEDESGSQTIPAGAVQSIVEELSTEHTSCPCSAASAEKVSISSLKKGSRRIKPESSGCGKALLGLMSEDVCGNENGPDASQACSDTCKPLACAVVAACPAGSTVQVEDESGSQTIPAGAVQSIVEELSTEHTSCLCSAASAEKVSISSLKKGSQRIKPESSGCGKALLGLMSEDACGNENGPDASQACSDTCKPLACAVVAACPAGSTVQVEDESGSQTIPAGAVQSIVEELSTEHTSCPCSSSQLSSLRGAKTIFP